jgi:hypothetical protein
VSSTRNPDNTITTRLREEGKSSLPTLVGSGLVNVYWLLPILGSIRNIVCKSHTVWEMNRGRRNQRVVAFGLI